MQTGKATPAPIVLLDVPGGTYWKGWQRFVDDELVAAGWSRRDDPDLFLVTDDVDEAVDAIRGFWRNYHSIRWVGDRLVIRLRAAPTDDELAELNERFADLCSRAASSAPIPLPAEVSDNDQLDLPRLVMRFDVRKGGRVPGPDQGLERTRLGAPARGRGVSPLSPPRSGAPGSPPAARSAGPPPRRGRPALAARSRTMGGSASARCRRAGAAAWCGSRRPHR